MKKIINWFKKRTMSKLLIVLFAVCTIGFLAVGRWWPALIEFAFLLSWVAMDLKDGRIESLKKACLCQDNTIDLLIKDNEDEHRRSEMFVLYLSYWKDMYGLADTKARYCQYKINSTEFRKLYDYYIDHIERDRKELKEFREKKFRGE